VSRNALPSLSQSEIAAEDPFNRNESRLLAVGDRMQLLPLYCVQRGDWKSEYHRYKILYPVNRPAGTLEKSGSGISGGCSAEIRAQQDGLQPRYFSNRWCRRQSA